jgi:hypothetical protein
VIRDEIAGMWAWEERHARLLARMIVAGTLTLVVDVVGTVLIWSFERHAPNTQIHTLGDAFFFTTVQLLTVSSQLSNPFTTGGRVVDVFLELWAIFVVTAVAGSFAAFFSARS